MPKIQRSRRIISPKHREYSVNTAIPSRSVEATSWKRNQTECLLFRLPAELRLSIYELVLGRHTIYVQHGGHQYRTVIENGKRRLQITPLPGFHCTRYPPSANPYVTILNQEEQRANRGQQLLNSICREFYRETADLPYKWNTWSFQSLHVMRKFVAEEKRLPLSHLRAINTLFIQEWYFHFDFGDLFGGLKTLLEDKTRVVLKYKLEEAQTEEHDKSDAQITWQMAHGNPPYDFL